MRYTAIIMDFDGTLFDTRRAIASTLAETFAERGLAAPDDAAIWATIRRGVTLEATFTALLPPAASDDLTECVLHYRRIYNSGAGIAASAPFPGARDAIARLAADPRPVVVVSNKGMTAVETTLSHFGMRAGIDLVVAAEGPAPTKPDPASFHMRIRPALGAAASRRPLVVGDTDADIRYARAIGAGACWATYGYGDPERCEPLAPDHRLAALDALPALFAADDPHVEEVAHV